MTKFAIVPVLAMVVAAAAPAQTQTVADPVADLLHQTPPDKGGFRREGGGLRVETPKPSWLTLLARPTNLGLVEMPYTVGGDAEFTAAYAVNQVGAPDRPTTGEANAELSLAGRGGKEHVGVNVGYRPGRKGTGKCFNVVRIHPNAGGLHYNILTFDRLSDTGRIGIRRRGTEIAFLAADGPGAAFAELVRYPYDPLYSPAPRVSAFRGYGKELAPVDVLFTDMTLKADRVNRGPDASAVPPSAPPPTNYPVKIDYARNPAGVLADFARSNDQVKAFQVEGMAVRVRPPVAPTHRKGDLAHYWHDSRFAVAGDFEITWRVDVARLGPFPADPSMSYGSCAVSLALETESPLGSVILSRGAIRGGADSYSVTRYSPTKGGQNWDTQRFPARNSHCRLTMRRTGAELSFLAADGDDPAARELARIPFTPGPVKRLRLSVDQGGSATVPVDAALSDLSIQAGAIVDPDAPAVPLAGPAAGAAVGEQVVIDAVPRGRSRKWDYLAAGGVALLGAASVALLVVFKRRRA